MSEFTPETWRARAAQKLGELGHRMRVAAGRDVPYVAYSTLAGLALWPAVEQAVTTGEAWRVMGALFGIGAGVGSNLIASRIEAWTKQDDRPSEAEVIAWAAAGAGDAALRDALDAIVERLDALPAAAAALDEAERPTFAAALRRDAGQLGNLTTIDKLLTGGGAVFFGSVSAARDIQAGTKTVHGHEIRDNVFHGPVTIGTGDESKPDTDVLHHAYMHYVFQTTSFLTLGGVDPQAKGDAETRLELAAVYTALLTGTPRDERMGEPGAGQAGRERRLARSAVEELNRHPRLVLMGDPGSGKSTFAGFAALCLSGEALADPAANLDLLTAPLPDNDGNDEQERQPWGHGPLLPVLVVLRDFAATGLPPAGQKADAETLWRYLDTRLTAASLGEFAPLLRRELRQRGGLLILDGLDEVPEADSRRKQIKQVIEGFAAAFSRCRILVTSRTYAYQKQDWKLPHFAESTLAPFGDGQMRRFIARWYDHIGGLRDWPADDARGKAAELRRAIDGSERLRDLAERPLLLTLMASLHAWHGGVLPDKREELYHESVNMLLDWWERQRIVRDAQGKPINQQPSLAEWLNVDRDRVREWLNELAFTAHSRQPELAGTANIAQKEIVDGLMALSDDPDLKPRLLVEYLSHRAGLLVPHGVGVYTFPHRTFQEYLAACHLTDLDNPEETIAGLVCADLNRWREVTLLAAAKRTRGGKGTVWLMVDELCPDGPEAGGAAEDAPAARGALLAGQVLLESADLARVSAGNTPKVERVRRWQKALLAHPALPDVERAAAGRALADLGDDRAEVMTVDAMQFCLVPGGPFRMGEDKALHTNDYLTSDIWLGRYPVTNAQFAAFADDGGYDNPDYWREAANAGRWKKGEITDWEITRSQPYDYGRPYTLPNHPVVGITWYEALAFARWLTARWRASGALPRGWEARLPSEAEWEKAARGGLTIPAAAVVRAAGAWAVAAPEMKKNPDETRRHPWTGAGGPRRANTTESTINSTSAAGLFPHGASPYGCEEMAGTVWEWTRSLYDFEYPYVPDERREHLGAGDYESRVIRGGSYAWDLASCRCALRLRNFPLSRLDYYGCRVLVAPSGHL
ncbi:MAG: SUMF1/EgtB/PvdO family nonheme iron enzyme [Candidatus Promineofilum sp.]|nr:SUMF1/EgtB/PvdO family nonheme iron enzyme [Promineifilum sp.]